MTHLVSFFTAVEADLRLWTLVNLVTFLLAPPTLLWLGAVSGHVTLLENIIKSRSPVQCEDKNAHYLPTVPALHRLRAVRCKVAFLETTENCKIERIISKRKCWGLLYFLLN